MKTRIMFINAIDTKQKIEIYFSPLGLGYLASSLRKKFGFNYFTFRIIDRDIKREIKKFKPDIIGITSVSQNYNRAIHYAEIAKTYDLPVIMGGVHISTLPHTLTNNMDVGVIGEGEETIIDLFNLFEEKRFFDKNKMEKIDGIVFRNNNKIIVTKKRNLIQPIDKIPMPARDLLTIDKTTYMFTSRGCCYRCYFCASSRFWDRIRFFSAEYVVNEIKYLIEKYDVQNIAFCDDLFIADIKRVRRIVELLEQDDILGKINFSCSVRSNLINEEMVQLLKKMNVKSVGMGLESGSQKTLKYLKRDNISIDDHINSIKMLRKYGIKSNGSFIIGSPKESGKDILQTLKFIKENRIDSIDVYVLTPFPGTPVWEYAKKRQLVRDDMDWERLNVNFDMNHKKAIILSETLTRDEIYKLFLLFSKEKKKLMAKKFITIPSNLLKNPKFVLLELYKMFSGK